MQDFESARLLVEQRLVFLNTVANVCIIWWTSSVVFCASILAVLWQKRGRLGLSQRQSNRAAILFTVFFLSIIGFGLAILVYLWLLRDSLKQNLTAAGMPETSLNIEINTFIVAMLLGTLTFVFVLLLWWSMRKEVLARQTSPSQ